MKVAALCDFPYWERRVGTAIRYESLCQSLSRICDLTVISSISLPFRYKLFPSQSPYDFKDRKFLQKINDTLPQEPIPGLATKHHVTVRAIKSYLESENFDAVLTPYFNRKWMVEHLNPNIVRIIDTHDCQSQRTRSFARHGMLPTFNLTPEAEGKLLDCYDLVIAMSDEDHEEFSKITLRPIVTAPFRLPLNPIYSHDPKSNELLFIAANSPVNNLTLEYLLRDILPLVPRRVVLHVVGNVAVPDIYPSNVDIEIHRDVDDISPIYRRVALSLNPTYAGGGVKTKTLEAISFGVPVLNSDEAARGMRHLIPDELIANDKEVFAWRIENLLRDHELRNSLSKALISNLEAENNQAWVPIFASALKFACMAKSSSNVEDML